MAKKSLQDKIKEKAQKAQERNKKAGYKSTFSIKSRYIYFDSLREDNPSLASAAATYLTKALFPKGKEGQIQDEYDSITYIQDYIKMLSSLRDNELAAEEAFLKTYPPEIINKYYNNKSFDYLQFITALNVGLTGEENFKEILNNDIQRFNVIKDTVDNYVKQLNEKISGSGDEWKDKLKRLNETAYNQYAREMRIILGSTQLNKDLAVQISEKINDTFKLLLEDDGLLKLLVEQIMDKNFKSSGQTIEAVVQNFCVEYVSKQFKSSGGKVSQIKVDTNSLRQAVENFVKATEVNYSTVMHQAATSIENILDIAFTKGKGGIAALLDDIENEGQDAEVIKVLTSLQQIIDMQAHTNSGEDLINYWTQYQKDRKTSQKSARAALTRHINTYVKNMTKEYEKISTDKRERADYVEEIIKEYEDKIASEIEGPEFIQQAIAKAKFRLKTTVIGPSSVAEILSTTGFSNFVTENIGKLTIPGTQIQYKSDITFAFSNPTVDLGDIDFNKLLSTNRLGIKDKEFLANRGDFFLKEYQKKAKGSTSVTDAIEAWKTTQKKTLEVEEKLSSKGLSQLEKFIEGIIDGSISVKEYQLYNDDFGYHMGSMGGGGRVVEAIPNIVKMLETGGIGPLDAEIIITALLNCFEDSIIGTEMLDDLKNLLIGGAAMMLFDDGFANCKGFLDKMADELKVSSTKLTPSLHLLYLNGVYYPQSYILTNVINNLNIVYSDIVSKADTLTEENGQNRLELFNPLSSSILDTVRNDDSYTKERERWDAVSLYAQETVKISFMFMAGMLDILTNITNAFNP